MLPVNQEVFLVKANQLKLRYGIYNEVQHTLKSIYTDFPIESISFNEEEAWSVSLCRREGILNWDLMMCMPQTDTFIPYCML